MAVTLALSARRTTRRLGACDAAPRSRIITIKGEDMIDSSNSNEKEIERVAERPASDVEGHRHRERHIEAPDRHIEASDEFDSAETEVEGHSKRIDLRHI